ncbi:MAG TPA: hemerythrin domain-containing protein [Acidimicrobiia bacterium]|nr:hemerythrin domain-containing protein [Acidimicrobiia bacterium]
MPDAAQILMQDHRTVEQLFDRYEAERDPDLVTQITSALQEHTQIEEELLYPELRGQVSADMAAEAEDEHAEAKELIAQIQSSDDDDEVYELMSELRQSVDHHVEEEENEIFPAMEEQLGERMSEIGQEIERRKGGSLDLTKEELYERAQEREVEGRSKMDKEELARALQEE